MLERRATLAAAIVTALLQCCIEGQQVQAGSLSVQEAAECRIELSEKWLLRSSFLVAEGGDVISSRQFKPAQWYRTSVPSTVLSALTRNGVYPDMRVGLNSFRIPDSSDSYNERHNLAQYSHLPDKRNPWRDPYWYRTQFSLPTLPKGTHVWLNFDAINYRVDVWLNGKQIAKRDSMAGMFQRFRFDISTEAKAGENVLAAKIYPVDHPGDPDTQLDVFGHPRGYVDKAIMRDVTEIMTIGYDCMPTVPDRNMGIWQDVYIEFTGPVDIRNPFVVPDLPLPRTDEAVLKISAEVFNCTNSAQKGVLIGKVSGTDVFFEQQVELAPGQSKEVTFDPFPVLQNPRLWWPVNYGSPNLYSLNLAFKADKLISDSEEVTFGVREVSREFHKLDGFNGMQLHINGEKIFCRGGYIQHEVLFDWDKERMETEVKYFTSANQNMVYFEDIPNPPDEFLDACDRYGLLFGTCFYGCYWLRPGTNYPDDVGLLEKCTVDILKRYRNHPCIWLHMAMNEEDTRQVVYEMWRKHVIELDGTRIWIPSAYFPDDRKNVPEWFRKDLPTGMTDIGATYTWKEPKWYYETVRRNRNWMFMMESGSASLPPIESLKRFIDDLGENTQPDVYPLNRTWAHHGANSYYKDYDQAVRRIYGNPTSVADYCMKGHLTTADQHRSMFEAVNHRMWDITSGFTEWKINACWPSVQWQIFDWYLKPMVSYYYMKKACEPLHVQLGLLEPTVTVVNNLLIPQRNLRLQAKVCDFNMQLLFEKSSTISVEANTYQDAFTIDNLSDLTPVYFVTLELRDPNGKVVSDNFYWLSSGGLEDLSRLKKLPLVNLDMSYMLDAVDGGNVVHVELKNPTDKLAFFVHAVVSNRLTGEEILPVFWSDNYISLLPGKSKCLDASFSPGQLKGITPSVEIGGWNIRSHFECMELQVSAEKVKKDEEFTVTARIKDTFIDGSPVELVVDGKAVDHRLVWGQVETSQAQFSVGLSEPGRHEIAIGAKRKTILVE